MSIGYVLVVDRFGVWNVFPVKDKMPGETYMSSVSGKRERRSDYYRLEPALITWKNEYGWVRADYPESIRTEGHYPPKFVDVGDVSKWVETREEAEALIEQVSDLALALEDARDRFRVGIKLLSD